MTGRLPRRLRPPRVAAIACPEPRWNAPGFCGYSSRSDALDASEEMVGHRCAGSSASASRAWERKLTERPWRVRPIVSVTGGLTDRDSIFVTTWGSVTGGSASSTSRRRRPADVQRGRDDLASSSTARSTTIAELRHELRGAGSPVRHALATREVIVHAYEEWGVECLRRFTGMFAFALWDERDAAACPRARPAGQEAALLRSADGRLVFASRDEGRPRAPGGRRGRSTSGRSTTTWRIPTCRRHRIFAGVAKLPPAHWMRWKDGALQVEPYWKVDLRPGPARPEEEWAERVEAELRRSVRLRLSCRRAPRHLPERRHRLERHRRHRLAGAGGGGQDLLHRLPPRRLRRARLRAPRGGALRHRPPRADRRGPGPVASRRPRLPSRRAVRGPIGPADVHGLLARRAST